MKQKVRNLGFSLVELIVAFAIRGVATLGVGSCFVAATRNSSKTHEQSGLYNETQLASNQIGNMLQETELALSYLSDGKFVPKDTNPDAEQKVLYIFNASPAGKAELILLKWDKTTKEITYKEMTNLGSGDVKDINIGMADTNWALLAEDVESFSAVLEENTYKVFLDIQFDNNTAYQSKQTITLRNKVILNPTTLEEVTEKITVNVESEIKEVKINVSPKILAPGASVQLDSDVFGIGVLPAYTTRWLVAKDFAMEHLVGDSSNPESAITVDTNGVMSVKNDLGNHTGPLYVQAIVTSDNQVVKSNIEEFKIIKDMKVTVDDSQVYSSLTQPLTTNYQISNGLKYQMKASFIGNSLSVFEQNIKWSLEDVAAGVNATITSDGVLEIANYSYGGSLKVVASLAKNPTVRVAFPFYVRGTHAQGDSLVLIPTTKIASVNRGGEIGFNVSVKSNTTGFNGIEVDPEDCNWSFIVKQGNNVIGTDAVTIGTSGVVSVKENLPFSQSYTIEVTASLKKDSNVSYTILLTVPAVSVDVETPTIEKLVRGESLDLKCTVTGLENYQLDWSMARSLKPTYYFGALGNTSISGVKEQGIDYGRLVFGSDEPAEVTDVTVQAELVGYPAYRDSVKISTLVDFKVKFTQNGKEIAIDAQGNGSIEKNKKGSFWGITYEDSNPVYISIEVENGDRSKVSWTVTGNGVDKVSLGNGFEVLSSGKGPAIVTITYAGVSEFTKVYTLTVK